MSPRKRNDISACITENVNVENIKNSGNLSDSLKKLKIKNSNQLVLDNLNINTINNKFDQHSI